MLQFTVYYICVCGCVLTFTKTFFCVFTYLAKRKGGKCVKASAFYRYEHWYNITDIISCSKFAEALNYANTILIHNWWLSFWLFFNIALCWLRNIPTYARYLMGVVYNEIVFQFAVYYLRVCVSIHLLKHDSLLKHREHKIK